MWTVELEQSHAHLSRVDTDFRKFALAKDELLRRETFKTLENEDNPIFRYKLQSWPTFMDRDVLAHFAEISVGISRLVRSIPETMFDLDAEKICDFFDLGNPFFVELALAEPNGIDGCITRGDFVYGEDGFKCLEFNVTSSLGGWETASIADLQLQVPAVREFVRGLDSEISASNTLRALFVHTITRAVEAGLVDRGEVNTAIGLRDPISMVEPPMEALLDREYAAALALVDRSLRGSAFFCDYDGVTDDEGSVYYHGKRIHALVERHQVPSDPKVFRAFKSRRLHLYNGPVSLVLSDKRNLALLSEHESSERFSREDRELIRTYIPWTRLVKPGKSRVGGEEVDLDAYLLAERERMVLKKGRSLGGADVVIGRFATDEEWAAAVGGALASGDWVAQEFVESRPYLYQSGERGCSAHDVVWGPFVFGDAYAGTILRLQPKSWNGIVNLTRGATEGMIFEISDPPRAA